MKRIIPLAFAALLLVPLAALAGVERLIHPGDSPQAVLDSAAPGDRLVFLPGLHQHGLGKYRSMLYVDKPVEIELKEGATLKLADGVCQKESTGEITTDQDSGKRLDDMEIGGGFDLKGQWHDGPELYGATVYTVIVDGVGQEAAADTFAWGDGKLFETPNKKIAITGDWQELSHGVKIRFGNRTGHSLRSLWFVSYDGPEAYGIRIGHGHQAGYIENVRITGKGTIDLNSAHNALPSGLVKNINACVLIHGRVRNVLVEGITMTNTMRSVMCYGEHTGKFLPGGKVGPGESFDAENITIQHTRTLNPTGSAYLLGHPSFRGQLRNVKCNHNYMETARTAIEPNFNLDGYEVIDNVIKSGGEAIHCWRHSKNGVITDNLRVGDNTGKQVISINAPAGWENPEPPKMKNNRNHLGEAAAKPQAAGKDKVAAPFGRRVLVSDFSGGKVAIIAADGQVEWEYPAEKSQDVWMLTNGNVLFSHLRGAREVTMAKKIVWEYTSPEGTEVQGCQPLPDGRVMVVECGTKRLVEVGRDGKTARVIAVPVKTKTTHDQMRGCRRTLDGRYLVSAKGDRAILELSAEGKLLREIKTPGDPHEVRELPNGHLLIACGEGEALLELDREGKTIWRLGTSDVPNNPLHLISGFQRLPNGHTVVINWLGHGYFATTAQFFELDEQKQIVRQFTDHRRFVSINKVQLLDVSGDPAKGEVWR